MMLQRFVDLAAVEAEIEHVRSLSGNALRRRWQSVFGRSPPEHLTADLLRRMIANRIQEEAFGTLDRATSSSWTALPGATVREKPSTTSRSALCWSATIRAGATPSWSRPRAMPLRKRWKSSHPSYATPGLVMNWYSRSADRSPGLMLARHQGEYDLIRPHCRAPRRTR
jgi:hypothetical protein